MISLNWVKNAQNQWLQFEALNLSTVPTSASGVYIIWHAGNPGKTVKVGQGNIYDRLCAHRNDPYIMAYRSQGTLHVTWAIVPAAQLDGVERYLGNYYKPLVGDRFPDALPLAVNLP